jgi:hypothetical protein
MLTYNEINQDQWLKILRDYQHTVNKSMREGCLPDQFKKLDTLKKGLNIVILRIQQNNNSLGVMNNVF